MASFQKPKLVPGLALLLVLLMSLALWAEAAPAAAGRNSAATSSQKTDRPHPASEGAWTS